MSKPNPVPALIVSGFLGAGKTTLVQHLLEQAQAEGVRLAIVSNEFGDTGIDRALLDAGEEGFVELDGGCVCCRLSDALSETLEALLTQVRPDRLVLETSGVALPGEIVIQFWRPPLSELIHDEVVAVVVEVLGALETVVLVVVEPDLARQTLVDQEIHHQQHHHRVIMEPKVQEKRQPAVAAEAQEQLLANRLLCLLLVLELNVSLLVHQHHLNQ